MTSFPSSSFYTLGDLQVQNGDALLHCFREEHPFDVREIRIQLLRVSLPTHPSCDLVKKIEFRLQGEERVERTLFYIDKLAMEHFVAKEWNYRLAIQCPSLKWWCSREVKRSLLPFFNKLFLDAPTVRVGEFFNPHAAWNRADEWDFLQKSVSEALKGRKELLDSVELRALGRKVGGEMIFLAAGLTLKWCDGDSALYQISPLARSLGLHIEENHQHGDKIWACDRTRWCVNVVQKADIIAALLYIFPRVRESEIVHLFNPQRVQEAPDPFQSGTWESDADFGVEEYRKRSAERSSRSSDS